MDGMCYVDSSKRHLESFYMLFSSVAMVMFTIHTNNDLLLALHLTFFEVNVFFCKS